MNIYGFNYSQFAQFVNQIKYGYIDRNGNKHLDAFSNPNEDYQLQTPDQLIKSNTGLCFDIVELYREYLTKRDYVCESYYLEYNDGKILETHSFIIHKRKNNLWYECIDNSWENAITPRGYYDKEGLIKSIYEWFQEYVSSFYNNIDKTNFFMTKYDKPISVFNNEMTLHEFCAIRPFNGSHRLEHSGMAIVFCKGKVLVLETKHNEYVFPKGHIEAGETSKDASIRECNEESGINIKNGKYYGECGSYSYTFSAGHLKITNDDFYNTFGTSSITKSINAHVYEIDDFQEFHLEPIFNRGKWVPIEEINLTLTHPNTKSVFESALELFKNKK